MCESSLGTTTIGWISDDTVPVKNPAVEAHLREVQFELLSRIDSMDKRDTRKNNSITNQINALFAHLCECPDLVVVPTLPE